MKKYHVLLHEICCYVNFKFEYEILIFFIKGTLFVYCILKLAVKLLSFISIESDHIRRKLPTILKEGEPNLLLVPKGMKQILMH